MTVEMLRSNYTMTRYTDPGGAEGNNGQKLFSPVDAMIKWGWSVRSLARDACTLLEAQRRREPAPGDVIMARVAKVGNHSRIYMDDGSFSRLYEGDTIIGVIGFRYATDAFHAPSADLKRLHLLTNAGLCGTARERHASTKAPTKLQILGFLRDKAGKPVNLIDRLFRPRSIPLAGSVPVILTVGTGMNSGKTTVAAGVGHALAARGCRTALLKLTGSVTCRDLHEFRATGAVFTRDFSDYGFPSTYLVEENRLFELFQTMIADAIDARPDLIVAEIADGVLQRETQMLLRSSLVSQMTAGVLLAASCATSALALIEEVNRLGYTKLVMSGKITNAPLFVEELRHRVNLPVFDCFDEAPRLAEQVLSWLETFTMPAHPMSPAPLPGKIPRLCQGGRTPDGLDSGRHEGGKR